jgi:hypothetical protein
LLPAFDSWRTRGLSDLTPIGVTRGSFDWLVQGFKRQLKYKDVDAHTKRTYDNGTQLFADHILKDGSRGGSKQVGDFTKAFVDVVYAKLLVVESLDAEGNVVRRERRRMAIAAMGACRRAWFVMQRAEEAIVPADNPFAKMGLKKLAPGQKKTETPTATWDELLTFREAAVKLGYASLATAALTAWEWLQREEHLFGAFEISHYVRRYGQIASVSFIPKRVRKRGGPCSMKRARSYFRCQNWTPSFRHGGLTEGADSDLSDAELRAAGRHRSAR